MKRYIKLTALLLAVLTCTSLFAACSNKQSSPTSDENKASSPSVGTTDVSPPPSESPLSTTPSTQEPDDDGNTPDDIFTSLNYTPGKVEEHKVQATLPAAHSLVGTDYLPPVGNQGAIGSCASESITYLQFTNAAAQYAAKINPASSWKPAKDASSCFSSKYTYQFCNAATAAVYCFLKDHGAVTRAIDDFARNDDAATIFKGSKNLQTQTTRWVMTQNLGEQALSYRITNYEQYWVTDPAGDYYNSGKTDDGKVIGVQLTTSEKGKELLYKIKDAVAGGNVVVTGGYPDTWKTAKLLADSGTAKKGDVVITHASYTTSKGGGHQVAIVGYDDNIEYRVPGTTNEKMKGAFLIQNSWGTGWHNDGYTWMFYDAVNTVSEHEKFKIPKSETRDWALDQFCFIYWDRDITNKKPGMYAELEIETTDRDALSVELGKTDAYGRYESITPSMFAYSHPVYTSKTELNLNAKEFYLNTDGEVNGKASTAFYTVNFGDLLATMMDGTTIENYTWSIRVTSKKKTETNVVTLKSVVVKDGNGETLHKAAFDSEAEKLSGGTNTYVFRTGDTSLSKSILAGEYTFQNVADGKYIAADTIMTFKTTDAEKDALKIELEYLPEEQAYLLWRIEKGANKGRTMVLDVNPKEESIMTGTTLQYNAQSKDRAITQQWKLSHNSDGTLSFYIKTEKGTNYALAIVDGKLCLKKATELSDDIKWNFTLKSGSSVVTSKVSSTAEGLKVDAGVGKVAGVKIVVSDMTGKVVAESAATAKDGKVTATVKVDGAKKGATYLVKVLEADDGTAAASFTFVTIA